MRQESVVFHYFEPENPWGRAEFVNVKTRELVGVCEFPKGGYFETFRQWRRWNRWGLGWVLGLRGMKLREGKKS